jgi:hypothetical protein
MNSYIGITGIRDSGQVQKMLDQMPKNFEKKLKIGVLANEQTIHDNPSNPTHPDKEILPTIFLDDSRVLNFIHFNTNSPANLLYDLLTLIEIGGKNLHGFQIDMNLLNTDIIKELKECFPKLQFVISINKENFQKFSPRELSEEIQGFNKLADYALLDYSMGSGIEMNTQLSLAYAKAIRDHTGLKLVFGGGLCADKMEILKPIIKEIPKASIDAQGQLFENGVLYMKKVLAYQQRAISFFTC